jgi:hypothetical protein
VVAVTIALAAVGCDRGDGALGPPDSYLVFAPLLDEGGKPRHTATGLPVLSPLALDNVQAAPLHKLFAVGFAGEILRTDYLVKQLIRDAEWQGRRFPPDAVRAASHPTVFQVGRALPEAGVGVALRGFLGRATEHPQVRWLGLAPESEKDPAFVQTLTGKLARRVARAVASGGSLTAEGQAPVVLVEGYGLAMEVIAREWRVGEGPQGAVAPDAGSARQRQLFAAIRSNRHVMDAEGQALRPANEMVEDPGVTATVLYRMAQSRAVGHRVAPRELYKPFVSQRVPDGVSPAAVLGPFRNFQAKLIAVWGGAVLRGKPPRDIIDLVETYVRELPAERSEAVRLFVVTTQGATVKPGGVTGTPEKTLPELTALAAEVAAGRRSLRQALPRN